MRMQNKYNQVVITAADGPFIAGCITRVVLTRDGKWIGYWKQRRVQMMQLGAWREVPVQPERRAP